MKCTDNIFSCYCHCVENDGEIDKKTILPKCFLSQKPEAFKCAYNLLFTMVIKWEAVCA